MIRKALILSAFFVFLSHSALAGDAVKLGNKFINIDVSSNTLTQLIAPSTNTAGIYIQTASISNSGSVTLLYASATAPVAVRDLSTRTVYETATVPSGGWSDIDKVIFVPAGMGLWLGATSAASIIMTYDVLS